MCTLISLIDQNLKKQPSAEQAHVFQGVNPHHMNRNSPIGVRRGLLAPLYVSLQRSQKINWSLQNASAGMRAAAQLLVQCALPRSAKFSVPQALDIIASELYPARQALLPNAIIIATRIPICRAGLTHCNTQQPPRRAASWASIESTCKARVGACRRSATCAGKYLKTDIGHEALAARPLH